MADMPAVPCPAFFGSSRAARLRHLVLETPITKKCLVYVEIVYTLVVYFLVSFAGVPYAAIYVLDVVNILCILAALKGMKETFKSIRYQAVIGLFLAFCAFLTLTDVLNAVRLPLVVWAVRNTFRFFGFFVACVSLLEMRDVDRIMRLLFVSQLVNVVVSLYQFSALGLRQDNLGGIFGSASGCNGFSNVFFCILLCYYSPFCLSGQKPMKYLVVVCVSTLVLAAMAEIKFFFFEFAAIMFVSVLMYAHKVRAFAVAALAVAALMCGLQVFADVFPESYASLFDKNEMVAYTTQGMAGYELSRFGAFGEINALIFGGDVQKEIFGVGFGGAEMSSNISMFNSAFYNAWGYLNYRWFSHQMWYIETGSVGFLLFVSLLVAHLVYTLRLAKRAPEDRVLLRFVALFTVVTIVNLWYNCSIRVEAAYLTFFVLSISCIAAKGRNQGAVKRV